MISVWNGKGLVLGGFLALGFAGCAAQSASSTKVAPSLALVHTENHSQVVHNFKKWLKRDAGWTQQQRLHRIEKDWLVALTKLPQGERHEVVAAIQSTIRSRRLLNERDLVLRQLLVEAHVTLADASTR